MFKRKKEEEKKPEPTEIKEVPIGNDSKNNGQDVPVITPLESAMIQMPEYEFRSRVFDLLLKLDSRLEHIEQIAEKESGESNK